MSKFNSVMRKMYPLTDLLKHFVITMPSPVKAQKLRIERLYRSPCDEEDEFNHGIKFCDPEKPFMAMVGRTRPNELVVRVFSGKSPFTRADPECRALYVRDTATQNAKNCIGGKWLQKKVPTNTHSETAFCILSAVLQHCECRCSHTQNLNSPSRLQKYLKKSVSNTDMLAL